MKSCDIRLKSKIHVEEKSKNKALYEHFRTREKKLVGKSSHVGPPASTPSATATSSVASAASAASCPLVVGSFGVVMVERWANLMVLVGL